MPEGERPVTRGDGGGRQGVKRLGFPLAVLWTATLAAWLADLPDWALAAIPLLGASVLIVLAPREETQAVDLKPAEPAMLGEEPATLAELADALPDPAVLFRADGSVLHANRSAVATFGAFAPGMPLMLKFRAPEMHALIDATIAGPGAPAPIDYAEKLPVERLHRVHAAAIGQGRLFVLSFRDLSEMRRIDRMRADFIANASHELRTPLASISGFVETLRGPARDDPAARAQFLDIMQAQTSRMARLIDDLLSLSRLEMRSAIAPGDRADVVHVVDTVLEQLAHQAQEAGVELVRQVPADHVEVNGDHDELIQVFENLVENAIKYGGSGGRVEVSVEESRAAPDPEVRVIVRDFGPGIPAEHIPRITERFYRVEDVGGRATKGTGLGLSIVKHILTRHNARLSIASRVGEGSSFTVSFPKAAAISSTDRA